MIVIDTNVIAYTLIGGDYTPVAEAVQNVDADWASPLLWRSEMLSLLSLYVRRKITPLRDAILVISEAEKLLLGGEYKVDSARVLELADGSGHSSYDCEFVALAESLSVKLVTFDKKLISAFPAIAMSADAFVGSN